MPREMTARSVDTRGYARVSTNDPNPEPRRTRLIVAGAIRMCTDVVSRKRFDRPGSPNASTTLDPETVAAVIRAKTLSSILKSLARHRSIGVKELLGKLDRVFA